MGRIDDIFHGLRSRQRRALMPFVCAGHPASDGTGSLLAALERGGASIAEVGFPFSDPVADGPVIAAAMHEAILAGVTPRAVFEAVAAARPSLGLGLVAMVSVSIVHRCGGPAGFAAKAAASGFDGLIVPDAPLEESGPLMRSAAESGLCYSHLIAPTTPPRRIEELAKASTGFVYLVARVGITGEQSGPPTVAPAVSRLRQVTDLPIAVGFGISSADHVRMVVKDADAAIVGSALVKRLDVAKRESRDAATEAESFVRELAVGLGPSEPAKQFQ